jgi:hypothetical protein
MLAVHCTKVRLDDDDLFTSHLDGRKGVKLLQGQSVLQRHYADGRQYHLSDSFCRNARAFGHDSAPTFPLTKGMGHFDSPAIKICAR